MVALLSLRENEDYVCPREIAHRAPKARATLRVRSGGGFQWEEATFSPLIPMTGELFLLSKHSLRGNSISLAGLWN